MSIRSFVATFVLVVPGVLCAQDKKAALADELLTLMKSEQMVEQMKQQLPTIMRTQLRQLNVPDSAKPKVDQMINDLLASMDKIMDWKSLKADYITIYTETYSEQELQGLVDFYKSPAGQAFVNKMPQVINRTMQLQQSRMGEMMAQIQESMKKLAANGKVDQPAGK